MSAKVAGNLVMIDGTGVYATASEAYSVTDGVGLLRADGTTVQRALTLNSSNNLDIDPDQDSTFLGIGSIIVLRTGKYFTIESADLGEDVGAMGADNYENLTVGYLTNTGWQRGDLNLRTLAQQGVNVVSGSTRMASFAPGGRFGVRPGSAPGFNFAAVGGCLVDYYADASSTSTDGSEDDLYTDTLGAGVLSANGDKLRFSYALSLAAHATATRKVKVYFGGTAIFDSTAQVTASSSPAVIEGEITRVSASVVRYAVRPLIPGMAAAPGPAVGEVTGLTLANEQVIKITGAAAAAGAASGDITARSASVDWVPAANMPAVPLSYRPEVWLKADSGVYTSRGQTLATANNQTVMQWYDHSGWGRHAVTALVANPPLYKTASLNGLPGIQFDGANDFLTLPVFAFGQPLAVYMVAKLNSTSIDNARLLSGGAGNTELFMGSGGFALYLFSGSVLGGLSPGTAAAKTIQALFSGGSSEISLNGGTKTTGAGGTSTTATLTLGGQYANGATANNASVTMYELLIYNRTLGAGEEAAVLEYLRAKWAHY